jgi:lipopolysaccharide transport system permease protein
VKELILAVWRFRFFIFSSIKNEFRVRFARSKLGGLWMVIHPLTQVLIYATVLSRVLSAKLPGVNNRYAYALYLMAGMLAWTLFSETITKCLGLFVDNGNLLKKMAFPRICLPVIAAGTVLINNLLLAAAIFGVFAVLGHVPGVQAIWLPALMLLTLLLALGVGLIAGVLNVFMRDLGQVVPVILQLFFWLTPVVYSISVLPESLQTLFMKNPLYYLVTSYQDVLVFNRPPEWAALVGLLVVTVGLLALAMLLFRRASAEMVDAL